jgi:AraC-like DNA-binding protein
MDRVTVTLDEPPLVANVGVGVHGTLGPVDVFRLPGLWQLHLYGYAGDLVVGGTTHPIRPGHVSLIPPDTEAHFHYRGVSEHLYAHLRLSDTGAPRTVPLMRDAGAEGPALSALLRQAVSAMPGEPRRATAEVWAALWRVVQLPDTGGGGPPGQPHSAVGIAKAHIEANLAAPLTVPRVALAAGVSHTHLTRLFRAETGDTVIAYVRRRRMELAGHLLRESTLSVSAIAALVGIPDLQAFNKTCRRELGAAPRGVRGGGAGRGV